MKKIFLLHIYILFSTIFFLSSFTGVSQTLNPGRISGDHKVQDKRPPKTLKSEAIATGMPNIEYQWEYSENNGQTWYEINDYNATLANYIPEEIPEVTTKFRRKASAAGLVAYSNIVTITIPPFLSDWDIDSYLVNNKPHFPQQGEDYDVYIKIWGQYGYSDNMEDGRFRACTDEGDEVDCFAYYYDLIWLSIPPNMSRTDREKLIYIEDERTGITKEFHYTQDILPINFYPGVISGDQMVEEGAQPSQIRSIQPASGGNGNIYYTWQFYEMDGYFNSPGNWIYAGSTEYYNPSYRSIPVKYRRLAHSGDYTVISNEVLVEPDISRCGLFTSDGVKEMPRNGGWCMWDLYLDYDGENCFNYDLKESSYQLFRNGSQYYSYEVNISNSNIRIFIPINSSDDFITNSFILKDTRTGKEVELLCNQPGLPLTGGKISGSQEIIYGKNPTFISSINLANWTGATYRWECSIDGSNWQVISGARGESYTPSRPWETTFYRRVAVSGNDVAYSNTITIEVPPPPCDLSAISEVSKWWTAGWVNCDHICTTGDTWPEYGEDCDGGDTRGGYFTVTNADGRPMQFEMGEYGYLKVYFSENDKSTPICSYFIVREERTGQEVTIDYQQSANPDWLPDFYPGRICGDQTLEYTLPKTITITEDFPPRGGAGCDYYYSWEYSIDGVTWRSTAGLHVSSTQKNLILTPKVIPSRTTMFRRRTASGGRVDYTNSVTITRFAPPCSLYTTSSKQEWAWFGGSVTYNLASIGDESYLCSNNIKGGSYAVTLEGVPVSYTFTGSKITINVPEREPVPDAEKNGNFILHEQITGQQVKLPFVKIDKLKGGVISGPQIAAYGSSPKIVSMEDAFGGDGNLWYDWYISGMNPTIENSYEINDTKDSEHQSSPIYETTKYKRIAHYREFTRYSVATPEFWVVIVPPPPCSLRFVQDEIIFDAEGGQYKLYLQAGGHSCNDNSILGGSYTVSSSIHGAIESTLDEEGLNILIPENTGSGWISGVITVHDALSGQTIHLPFEQLSSNYPPLTGGGIRGSQEILYGNAPNPFYNSAYASGGSGRIRYSWECSIDSVNWVAIPDAEGVSYTPSRPMNTTYYRRVAISGNEVEYSNMVAINVPETPCELEVWPPSVSLGWGGWKSPLRIDYARNSTEYGCTNEDLSGCYLTITSPSHYTHRGPLEYYFDEEDNTLIHINIPENPNDGYLVGYLHILEERTGQVFRIEFDQHAERGSQQLSPGSISYTQTITYGNTVTIESTIDASGGAGINHYSWEMSFDGERWFSTEAYAECFGRRMNEPSLNIELLTKKTYFRRRVFSAMESGYSNVVEVNLPLAPCGVSLPVTSVEIAQSGGWYVWELLADDDGVVDCQNSTIGGYYTVYSNFHHRRLESYVDAQGIHVFVPYNPSSEIINGTLEIAERRSGKKYLLSFTQAAVQGNFTAGVIGGDQTKTLGLPLSPLTNEKSAFVASGSISYQWERNTDGLRWEELLGATEAVYQPSSLALGITRFRRAARSSGMMLYSNEVLVNVQEPLPTLGSVNNYTVAFSPREASVNAPQLWDGQQQPIISYYDGLGRPIQTIQRGATPSGGNVVQQQEYDGYGREWRSWLPVSQGATNGAYISPGQLQTAAQRQYADSHAHSETQYEASPLSRPVLQLGVGEDWHRAGKGVRTDYLFNQMGNEELSAINYSINERDELVNSGPYLTNLLLVTRLTSEDGHPSWEFKDKLGRVVLTRVKNGGDYYSTYYVYDDAGDLRYVLPPLVANDISGDRLDKYAYRYRHDHRHRCVEKKLPGVEPTYIRYDELDRPTMVQDGNLREQGWWLHTAYDALGRVTEQYLATEHGEDKRVLSQNFYDHHGFASGMLAYRPQEGFDAPYSSHKGLLTGSMVYVDSLELELYSAQYYDDKGRVVQSHSQNHLGGYDRSYYRYSFTGEVLEHRHEHTVDGQATLVEGYLYDYDHVGRPLRVRHYLNDRSNAVLLVQNTYDELGRLVGKNQGGVTNTSYTYNVRGWQTQASGTHLTQQLYYQHLPEGVAGTPSYGGNISAMQWRANDNVQRGYTFTYDGLSRLTHAQYGEGSTLMQHVGRYNEQLGYDAHGNPTRITRWGVSDKLGGANSYDKVDELSFSYSGNQITAVADQVDPLTYYGAADFAPHGRGIAQQYRYDVNGNLSFDANKGIISVNYDHQNKPREVNFGLGHKLQYIYSGAGDKLRRVSVANTNASTAPISTVDQSVLDNAVYDTTVTDYVGNVVYRNGVRHMVLLPEGYLDSASVYHHYVRDHLGNNRVVVSQGGAVVQTNHYYPFGMEFSEEDQQTKSEQPYKFGGKEEQAQHGLNFYDFHARQYDPALVRFTSVDPLAENGYLWSAYAYCFNNPIKHADPDGQWPMPMINPVKHSAAAAQKIEKVFTSLAKCTDLNDVVVLGSALLSPVTGQGAINIDGTPADAQDVEAAKMGLLIPVVSGSALRRVEKAIDNTTDGAKSVKKFDGEFSTESKTGREAFRKAKDQNGIPRSQQPDVTNVVRDKHTGKPLKEFEYTNSDGKSVKIRKDNPIEYPDGGKQGKHFNAGKVDDDKLKLKQHHNYE